MNIIGNSLWEILRQVDIVTLLILMFLLLMSITCWAIALYKLTLIRSKQKEVDDIARFVATAHTREDLEKIALQCQGTVGGVVLQQMLAAARRNMSEKECELWLLSLDRECAHIIRHEEEYMTVISTSAAASPLIGLFGTVWGLIHSFLRISQQQSADIATVAPGIAEALITTLAGLIVAIPALILFHYIYGKIRSFEYSFLDVIDTCTWIIQRSFISKEL
ncbi:MAG: MotA/TolQ/ExbB proton channel family protein [Candidatus Babeliaceae bacterium]|jgi:biopolymer transport protein TolQ